MFNMFDELKKLKYFKEKRSLKSFQVKADLNSEPKRAFMIELFFEYSLKAYYFRNKSFIIDVPLVLNIEGFSTYPTFSFNKNHQIYTNITP